MRTGSADVKIEEATRNDFDELIALMDRSFAYRKPDQIPFRKLFPDLYQPTAESVECHRVIRVNGRMAASLGIYPLDLQMDRVRLRVGGIGAVSTDPRHRGKGCMSRLLEAAKTEMANEGYALSWLSGDRSRYARFGWERAGSAPHVGLYRRKKQRPVGDWKVARFRPGRSDCARLLGARRARKWKGLCDEATLLLKFQRLNTEVWEARRGERYAYCVFQTWGKRLAEWGGDSGGIDAILDRRIVGEGAWWAGLPPLRDEYTDFFLSCAEDVAHHLDNLAILDLEGVLCAYEKYLQACWPGDQSLALSIIRGKTSGMSRVTVASGRAGGAKGGVDVSIKLDELRMVRFLFGPARPSLLLKLPQRAAWLDQVFPLPFYMPYLWRV
ncbi:MAG: GNAT family N-acetyltransferase [Kiritimatiellae bacterium]|nr:GNAT family N-acetyltransferase [Kiritimatiellia bacterium]